MSESSLTARLEYTEDPSPAGGERWRRWRQFARHSPSVVGSIILILMVLLALLAPLFLPDPNRVDLAAQTRLHAPSLAHPFGTDHLGRDVLARSLFGARISLAVGFTATGVAISIGTLMGSLAGFYGGLLDNVLMRLIDVVLSLPILFVLIILQSLLTEPSIYNVIFVIAFTSWMGTARIVRGQVLKEREMDYVTAAYSIGATNRRIIWRHLLPNVIGPVIVLTTLQVGRVIILEAALSYLGFGVPRPHASWGSMLAEARDYLHTGPWIAIFPGLLLSITVLSFNFVGDGLAAAFNPGDERS